MPDRVAGGRYHLLDALRGLAALMVVRYHMADEPVGGAYLAVDFFFGLSGLVIAAAYDERLASGMTTLEFMRLRAIRLWPLLFLGVLLGVASHVAAHDLGRHKLLSGLLFNTLLLPNPLSMDYAALDGPSWSLFCELAVNLAYAVLLVRLGTQSLLAVAAVAAAIIIWGVVHYGRIDVGWWWWALPVGLARAAFAFAVGMLIARAHRGFARRVTWAAVALGVALAVALEVRFGATLRPLVDLALALIGFPLLLWIGARIEVSAVLRPLSDWLGEISYPIYVIHAPLVVVLVTIGPWLGLPPWLTVPVGLAAAAALAFAASLVIDVPVRRVLSARR